MRKFWIAAAAVALPIAAQAEGVSSSGGTMLGPLTAPSAAPNWTGFYVGGHGGYGWGQWDGDFAYPNRSDFGYDLNAEGWLYGVQVGANYQIGKIVLGVEADVTWSDDLSNSGKFAASNSYDWTVEQKLERFGTVRGRLGYTLSNNFLVYTTGGMAWGQTSAGQLTFETDNNPGQRAYGSVNENHIGYAVGGGAEWMLTPNITLRAEYLYLNFGERDYRFIGKKGTNGETFPNPHAGDSAPSDLDLHVIRGALNYKF